MRMKRLLHRMHLAGLGNAFDGLDDRAIGLHRERKARAHRLAVDDDGATAAFAGAAADMGAGEAEVVAQEVAQCLSGNILNPMNRL
jgi:hypothetical protein